MRVLLTLLVFIAASASPLAAADGGAVDAATQLRGFDGKVTARKQIDPSGEYVLPRQ